MPKRTHSDPLVTRIGQRFHQLRKERGLSLQALTHGKTAGSKGSVSQVERGQALPTLVALDRVTANETTAVFGVEATPWADIVRTTLAGLLYV